MKAVFLLRTCFCPLASVHVLPCSVCGWLLKAATAHELWVLKEETWVVGRVRSRRGSLPVAPTPSGLSPVSEQNKGFCYSKPPKRARYET